VKLLLCARKGKRGAGRLCSQREKESGEFTDEGEAVTKVERRWVGRRSSVIGAQLLRASRTRTCGMVGLLSARRNIREEERERRGSSSPATSFPGGGDGDSGAAGCMRCSGACVGAKQVQKERAEARARP
jgi:hypothetical protein